MAKSNISTEGESAQDASSHVVFATELFLEAEIVHDASSSEVVVFSTKSYIRLGAGSAQDGSSPEDHVLVFSTQPHICAHTTCRLVRGYVVYNDD